MFIIERTKMGNGTIFHYSNNITRNCDDQLDFPASSIIIVLKQSASCQVGTQSIDV